MTESIRLQRESTLPADGTAGTLVGRVWRPELAGPSPVVLRGDDVIDVSAIFPTVSAIGETADPAAALAAVEGERVCSIDELLANSVEADRDPGKPHLLSPVDLHVLKAAGVTFAVSMIERVIEERVRGDLDAAATMREEILAEIGTDLGEVKPGSESAAALKRYLLERGLWSQYLEVGIGPDAEIFTKAPVLSSVGVGSDVGVLSDSTWNNPEPEVVLAVSSAGRIWGATLGNDVNLRDIEGRSALLLGRAKDNNASCALGPFIRAFDATFSLQQVRELEVGLRVDGADGYVLAASSRMAMISRDPEDLVEQLMGEHHQYPDGAILMLGTMFAPVDDRDEAGKGFTHHRGDVVTISTPALGSLVNRVRSSEECAPWVYGISALTSHLVARSRT
jgi:fumarylacetoacetate (FAA) hydrolase family protein